MKILLASLVHIFSSSSSSVTATTINKLITVTFEREVGIAKRKKTQKQSNKQNKNTYVAGLEAPDTKVSMVVASTVVWGRLFQSWIIRGRNDCYWYCVRHLGCTYYAQFYIYAQFYFYISRLILIWLLTTCLTEQVFTRNRCQALHRVSEGPIHRQLFTRNHCQALHRVSEGPIQIAF